MNTKLHKHPRGFGGSGFRWADIIITLMEKHKISSCLDYGCGQSTLWKAVLKKNPEFNKITYTEYDPAIKGKEIVPSLPVDLVLCTDVLEHIEPEYLINVLHHIKSFSKKIVFFNIALHKANKKLPNGRNAHLIIRPKEWWEKILFSEIYKGWEFMKVPTLRPNKDFNLIIWNSKELENAN